MPTVLHRLSTWALQNPTAVAQRYKEDGVWKSITSQEYCENVFHLALFLESRGFTAQHVGAILSYNCPQWAQMDLAPLLLGGKSAGLYPNASAKDIKFILNHTEAKVVSVQNSDYFKKIELAGGLPSCTEIVICFEGDTSFSPLAISISKALLEGKKLAQTQGKKLQTYLDRLDPLAGAFIIYTSGTTGEPKGALLSHDNLAFTSDLVAKTWKLKSGDCSTFSFLPLCHIAEKMQNIGVGISLQYSVDYCTKFDNVAAEMLEVQPTLLLSVPRLWEKMVDGVRAKLAQASPVKKALADWSFKVATKYCDKLYAGEKISLVEVAQKNLATKLVLHKVRLALGLGRVQLAASGAAALNAHVARWFRSLDIEILEVFGQTESTGVICCTLPGKECLGTVGQPPHGIEFKLGPDGEILTRGRHVFVGYFKNPEATASTVVDGWLHTGDLGELNAKGMLKIRGRKKEIMKTSGGKMVAPMPIEEKLKAANVINQVCMVGDGRKYFSALITLTQKVESKGQVVEDAEIRQQVQVAVDEVNAELANHERIKYFALLTNEFTVETGELTPTLKIKRNVVEENYQGIIDSMYKNE